MYRDLDRKRLYEWKKHVLSLIQNQCLHTDSSSSILLSSFQYLYSFLSIIQQRNNFVRTRGKAWNIFSSSNPETSITSYFHLLLSLSLSLSLFFYIFQYSYFLLFYYSTVFIESFTNERKNEKHHRSWYRKALDIFFFHPKIASSGDEQTVL